MRLLVSWVRDFVNVNAPPAEIAEKLALRGFEVASIEPVGDAGDAVIDFEVTANRPDCLSVLGFAREIGTLYNLPVSVPSSAHGARVPLAVLPAGAAPIKVTIADAELCSRFAAIAAEVAPTQSPAWMTTRLQAAGVRAISPLVDITNYVLMELGQPLHAYDLRKLAGPELCARRARAGEKIVTLDGVERTLDPEALVIADASRAQGIAGVMGGGDSEVSSGTTTVVFEAACFAPASIRRTSKRLQLKTEASSRFERGSDVNLPVVALQRAVALLQAIDGGRPSGGLVDIYPAPRRPRRIHLRRERLARVLGITVPDSEVVRILNGLGIETMAAGDGWDAQAPTFRVDILREVDLIEEIGRHYGLDRLTDAFPPIERASDAPSPLIARERLTRRTLLAAGLSEAISFGIVESKSAEVFAPAGDAAEIVAVANPLSAKFDVLRPSLLPGLVDAVAHNRRHGRRDVALFEIGARFTATAGETRAVAFAWTGAAGDEHWSGSARDVDFFDAKGVVERLAEVWRLPLTFDLTTRPYLQDGQAAELRSGATSLGVAGRLSAAVLDRAGAPRQDAVYAAELDLDAVGRAVVATDEAVQPLPRHPFVVRDLSIVVSESLPAEIIRGTIRSAAGAQTAPLAAVAFFDRYQGKGVPDGSISLSVRLTFQAADRTLTDAEVQRAFDTILAALADRHGAVQR